MFAKEIPEHLLSAPVANILSVLAQMLRKETADVGPGTREDLAALLEYL